MDNETHNKILYLSAHGDPYRALQVLLTHIREQDKRIEALEKQLLADKPLISTYAAHANQNTKHDPHIG